MISQAQLQVEYNDMYKQLRNYIWNFDVVEMLAELECSVYEKCPDILNVRRNFYRLMSSVRDVIDEDEEMKKAFDAFSDLINSSESVYSKLVKVNEVIQQ